MGFTDPLYFSGKLGQNLGGQATSRNVDVSVAQPPLKLRPPSGLGYCGGVCGGGTTSN
jgi:hypothetical protein